jgi:hypothetical protein
MTHNLSFHYHADMTTKGLGSAKVEVFRNITPVNRNKTGLFSLAIKLGKGVFTQLNFSLKFA